MDVSRIDFTFESYVVLLNAGLLQGDRNGIDRRNATETRSDRTAREGTEAVIESRPTRKRSRSYHLHPCFSWSDSG